MMKTKILIALSAALLWLAPSLVCAQDMPADPTPRIAYNFNQAEGDYPSAGALQMPLKPSGENQKHGAPGSGVSGLPADRAWDASANTQMGVLANAPVQNSSLLSGTPPEPLFNAQTKGFTLCFWFKADQAMNKDSSVRFFLNANRSVSPIGAGISLRNVKGMLELRLPAGKGPDGKPVDKTILSRASKLGEGFNRFYSWVFVALVWDGTTVRYYTAGTNEPLSYMGGGPFTGPLVPTEKPIFIGNTATSDRGFDGFIDNVRFYDQALPAPYIEQLRRQDATQAQ